MGQQLIKCTVTECLHWAQNDNCDLHEIWVQRKPRASQGGLTSAVGSNAVSQEGDTFCASFDCK